MKHLEAPALAVACCLLWAGLFVFAHVAPVVAEFLTRGLAR